MAIPNQLLFDRGLGVPILPASLPLLPVPDPDPVPERATFPGLVGGGGGRLCTIDSRFLASLNALPRPTMLPPLPPPPKKNDFSDPFSKENKLVVSLTCRRCRRFLTSSEDLDAKKVRIMDRSLVSNRSWPIVLIDPVLLWPRRL